MRQGLISLESDKQDIVDPFFFLSLSNTTALRCWVTPKPTRHLGRVKMHFKLKLIERRPAWGFKCQGLAAQSWQSHPAPLAPANSSHCPSAPSLSSPAPTKIQQKITSPQIQQRAVWQELCRKTTVMESIFINPIQDAENSFAPTVN